MIGLIFLRENDPGMQRAAPIGRCRRMLIRARLLPLFTFIVGGKVFRWDVRWEKWHR